jgi:hypothetical protein
MGNPSAGIVKPALISGAIFGFLSGAPFVGLLNCACCALVIGAGFVAALLHSQELKAAGLPFDAAAGAKVGFLAGIFCGVVETIVSTISDLLFHEAALKWLIGFLEQIPEVPSEVIEFLQGDLGRGFAAGVGFELLTNLGVGIIFATVGGLIGAGVFKSRPQTAPPPPPAGQ